MSFVSVHQNKNKTTEDKISLSDKPSYHHHTNNLAKTYDYIIHSQPIIDNQSLQRHLPFNFGFDFAKIDIQPKLKVSQPDDVHEQEADRVAEYVMRMPNRPASIASTISTKEDEIDRKCSACEIKEEEDEKMVISRKP